ncbi:MAG: hypothetical protein RR136_03020 [Clostridia bacterium]
MIKKINALDFCYATENINTMYPDVLLYVFTKEYNLNYFSNISKVIVYIKVYISLVCTQEHALFVSFHETDMHEKYLFRKN